MKFHSLKDIDNKVPKPGSFKHFLRMHENGGRVVKGVNTTADVGVDAIKKQAAKFGNTVDTVSYTHLTLPTILLV